MATSYSQYFIGIPLSQIEVEYFHSGYIMYDLFNMIEEIQNSDDYALEGKIYNIDPHNYINANDKNLHSDTIKFIEWIQANKDLLQELGFELETGYNGCGDNPCIFGKYVNLGFGSDPYAEAEIVTFEKIDGIKENLAQFSEIVKTLDSSILEKFEKDNLINIWSNSHST